MVRTLGGTVVAIVLALAFAGTAHARGGNYALDGGTKRQQAQVRAGLAASRFDWGVVQRRVVIHIAPGLRTETVPGQIWIDSRLVDAGRFAWGIIQHEYAHQVDFFLFDDDERARLLPILGGHRWWGVDGADLAHRELGSERFASTLTWSYWQSHDNSLKPESPSDESAAMAPASFRALMTAVLDGSAAERTP